MKHAAQWVVDLYEDVATDRLPRIMVCLCVVHVVWLFQITAAAALQAEEWVAFGALMQLAIVFWQLVVLALLLIWTAARA